MVAPGGIIGTGRGEPTLLRKLQAAMKEAVTAKSPAKTLKASSRLQGISEEGGQGEEARMMKELQSQKARIRWYLLSSESRHRDLPRSRLSKIWRMWRRHRASHVSERARRRSLVSQRLHRFAFPQELMMTGRAGSSGGAATTPTSATTPTPKGQRIRWGGRNALYGLRRVLAGPAFP